MTRQPISEPLTIPPATATNTSGLETCIFPTATFIGLRRWAGGRSDPVPRCGAATTTTSKGVGGVTQYVDEGRVEGGWMLTCGDASVADGRRTSMDRSARDWGSTRLEQNAAREAMPLTS